MKWHFMSGVLHQIYFYGIVNPVPTQNEIGIKKPSCSRAKAIAELAGHYFVPRDRVWISLVKEFFSIAFASLCVTLKSLEINQVQHFSNSRVWNYKFFEACSDLNPSFLPSSNHQPIFSNDLLSLSLWDNFFFYLCNVTAFMCDFKARLTSEIIT